MSDIELEGKRELEQEPASELPEVGAQGELQVLVRALPGITKEPGARDVGLSAGRADCWTAKQAGGASPALPPEEKLEQLLAALGRAKEKQAGRLQLAQQQAVRVASVLEPAPVTAH